MATLLAPTFAEAQTTSPPDSDPQVPFAEGRALVTAGRFAEAATKFEESLALRPSVGGWLNLGDCHEKLGRYASALADFEQAAKLATDDTARATEARDRVAQLRSLASSLMVRLAPGIRAEVTLDDKPVAEGVDILVDGGDHVVKATAPCRKPFEKHTVIALRGDAQVVTVQLEPASDPGCSVAAPAPSRGLDQRTLALVVGGGGVVALGVGTFFAISAVGTNGDLEGSCSSYPTGCPRARQAEIEGLYDDAQREATVATIGFVAGAVLLAGGIALYVTARSDTPTPARARFAPSRVGFVF